MELITPHPFQQGSDKNICQEQNGAFGANKISHPNTEQAKLTVTR